MVPAAASLATSAELAPAVPVLLAWFDAAGRDLPWRRRRTLYGTWISEMMLQQTTVATVVPYWERFLARFPDVAALAAADEAEVLSLWSGLGYYRRARMLHAAARLLVDRQAGRLPADHAGWAALPGVGDYAAGAIASIGLGERVPALDANARRVLVRWCAADPVAAAGMGQSALRELGSALVPARRPGAWNEALMELGAIVCRARDPRCGACPVAAWCRAGRAGRAADVPPTRPRPAVLPVRVSVAVVRCCGQVLLLRPGSAAVPAPAAWGQPAREDLAGLHRGLWGLPSTAWFPAAAEPGPGPGFALDLWRRWAGSALVRPPVAAGRIAHGITRFRLAVEVVAMELRAGTDAGAPGGADAVWSPWPPIHPVSKLVRKVVARESHGSG